MINWCILRDLSCFAFAKWRLVKIRRVVRMQTTALIHHTKANILAYVFDLCLSMNYSISYSLSWLDLRTEDESHPEVNLFILRGVRKALRIIELWFERRFFFSPSHCIKRQRQPRSSASTDLDTWMPKPEQERRNRWRRDKVPDVFRFITKLVKKEFLHSYLHMQVNSVV